MNFEPIFQEIKTALYSLFKDTFKTITQENKKELDAFLMQSKVKLARWSLLLANKEITPAEFEWLIKSEKDLVILQSLYSAGISKIRIGQLKNKILNTIVSTILKSVLL